MTFQYRFIFLVANFYLIRPYKFISLISPVSLGFNLGIIDNMIIRINLCSIILQIGTNLIESIEVHILRYPNSKFAKSFFVNILFLVNSFSRFQIMSM